MLPFMDNAQAYDTVLAADAAKDPWTFSAHPNRTEPPFYSVRLIVHLQAQACSTPTTCSVSVMPSTLYDLRLSGVSFAAMKQPLFPELSPDFR